MLIEFRVENHRSLRDEQVLTMEAGRVGDDADPRPRRVQGISEELSTVALLCGANASGKSNVLSGLGFMRDAVLFSSRAWSPEEGVPRDAFAWGRKKEEPSFFEVSLILDEVRYQYGFLTTDEHFVEEWLYAWPNGKKQTWFERSEDSFKFGENLKGENKLIQEVTRSNALYLAAAVQFKHEQLQPIYGWFQNLKTVRVIGYEQLASAWSNDSAIARLLEDENAGLRQHDMFEREASPKRDDFVTWLKNADFGIVDVKVERGEPVERNRAPRRPRFYFKHQRTSDESWLPLEEESRGTQTLFRMAMPMIEAMRGGATILVDELDASLHPALTREIVRQFNDPKTNPRNAQLIFTTHDTNLIGPTVGDPVVRRDQVWLTEKDREGATVLYPLTDYKPRKAENLERGYLQGRYGATPFLKSFKLLGTATS